MSTEGPPSADGKELLKVKPTVMLKVNLPVEDQPSHPSAQGKCS